MTVGVCVTTRHRHELLLACLTHIEQSSLLPLHVVVSDDSSKPGEIAKTKEVVGRFPRAVYVEGPHRGVCANRNNALEHIGEVDHVAFLDDDALVTPDYFARAQAVFDAAPAERRGRLIVSGVRIDLEGRRTVPVKLGFRGYFVETRPTRVAGASYAVYPRSFFNAHLWDEQIYFGYEDAELSLRALTDGFEIVHSDEMVLTDAGRDQSTLLSEGGSVDAYNFNGEAARLYVGVKRYKEIERSLPKLALFVPTYFAQVTYSLAKRGSLRRLPQLVKLSNVASLFKRA